MRPLLGFCGVFIILHITFQPISTSRIVNISDAWLLSDADSPVFYRHFRDRVTWSEAESICQFHHSVLATVQNTGEFDRTRSLLQELDWSTPVWVGLSRVVGQPMFKWSTPAGATLLSSDGYWHEAPNALTSRALCVTVDPAADFRWRAVDCASPSDLYSFLCQIPVPTWARSERGGCLSPHWPSAEVTVQYLPQTRALEMTADCGLKGTKRIACKQHSIVDIEHMEKKLQCPTDDVTSVSGSATPPRPPTRHRRDTNPSTAPTPEVQSSHPEQVSVSELPTHTSAASRTPSAPTDPVPSSIVTSTAVTTGMHEQETTRSPPKVELSTQQTAQLVKVVENLQLDVSVNEAEPTVLSPTTEHVITALSSEKTVSAQENPTTASETPVVVHSEAPVVQLSSEKPVVSAASSEKPTPVSSATQSEPLTQAEATSHGVSSTLAPSSTAEPSPVTTPKHPAYLHASESTTTPSHELVTATSHPAPPATHTHPVSPHSPHHLSSGTPRNIAKLTHVGNHPPMVVAVAHTQPGYPRNVPNTHAHSLPLQHPIVMAEGSPRIVGNAEIHRSAEDHVTSRRRQFLPAPLRGLPPVTQAVTPRAPEYPEEEEEDEEERTDVETTVDPLNSQTEEELAEAAERRQHSRRANRPQHHTSQTRNLYPYLLNRMLG